MLRINPLYDCRNEGSRPREYGLINSSPDGGILSFGEKPGWGQITTNLANAAYI